MSGESSDEDTEWSDTPCTVNILEFSEPVGPSITLGDSTATFLTLFTPELLEHIVRETNRYAEQCISATHQGDGPPPTWTTTVDEVKAFIGFAILMGINELPEIRDYWSTNDQLHYFPVASRIPRKRFMELSTYLHFANNENIVARGQPEYDRLAKVRPVITALQKSFLEAYKPHRENAIDKAMIKFKGRSSLKQHLPMKPIKRGFKVWVRADSHNGYLCNFEIYTGKEDSVETNLGAKVVKKLSRTLVGKRYHLYFDNFFSSVSLMEDLLEDELYACGTFRKDRRGLPQAIVKTTLGR